MTYYLYMTSMYMYTYTCTYIHIFIYVYIYYKYSKINHMVTYKLNTFVYLNVDYHHQEHFFVREWNDSHFQNTMGGVKVMKFWIGFLLKTLILGKSKHIKKSSKILKNNFSDLLAILKKNCRLTPANFFRRKIPQFPSRSHNSVHNPHTFPSSSVPISP